MSRMTIAGLVIVASLVACAHRAPGPSQTEQSAPAPAAPQIPGPAPESGRPPAESPKPHAAPPPNGKPPSTSQAARPEQAKPPAATAAQPVPPPAAPSSGRERAASAEPAKPPRAGSEVKSPAADARTTAPAKQRTVAADSGKPQAAAELDLKSMEQRLRDTRAIGVFTKLSLKNEVDDLLNALRAFHSGRSETTLADLHQRFDLLVLKVLSLLQDGDPPLASAISTSREAMWGILADPREFQKTFG